MQKAKEMQGSGASCAYGQRLAAAAERGFISSRRREGERRVLQELVGLGFRRAQLAYTSDGNVEVRAAFGKCRIARTFPLKDGGILPAETIVKAAAESAARMDRKRIARGSEKRGSPTRPGPASPVCRLIEPVGARPTAARLNGVTSSFSPMREDGDIHANHIRVAA